MSNFTAVMSIMSGVCWGVAYHDSGKEHFIIRLALSIIGAFLVDVII